ncbi:myosin-G heavy chain-like [Anopheles moucheti]|uniref:myosin-G heavy chain-like n=1 Tax=Anopheles moucheti TaxID=186751 RepID=UPI0022F141C7|nr:myosin-G heavy chain-like [Anopheles moucheti]
MEAALNITTSSELASCITPQNQKENIMPVRMKAQHNGDTSLTPQISATKRRHLACHISAHNLIDLTTPPTKPRATTVGRKPFSSQSKAVQSPRVTDMVNIVTPSPKSVSRTPNSSKAAASTPKTTLLKSAIKNSPIKKAVQSPRVTDMVNIVTPSPKSVSRTPNSLKAAASTPKTTLLKSAIKNSRARDLPDAKNTSIPLISIKKASNVKLNTSRANTPKLTPASTKSSGKLRKHLISTLSEKKGDMQ